MAAAIASAIATGVVDDDDDDVDGNYYAIVEEKANS